MSENIFISYSHADAALVTPVVRLLRATKDFVYLDSDSIRPGKKWRTELSNAILNANLVVVFWCLHSEKSDEIAKEYRAAIQAEKDILPVLLDSTPVPLDLSEFQWIDFRELARKQHADVEARPESISEQTILPPKAAPAIRRFRSIAIAAAAMAIVAMGIYYFSELRMRPIESSPHANIEPHTLSSIPVFPLTIIIALLIVLALMARVIVKRRNARISAESPASPAIKYEQQMAESLKDEFVRRLRASDTR